ncbi:MAG: GAF domain-containing sensor histidine kinase [Actinomycetota bacterium]
MSVRQDSLPKPRSSGLKPVAREDEGLGEQQLIAALLSLTGELEVEKVLVRIVMTARQISGARHAALGVLDERGQLVRFVPSGIGKADISAIGGAPKGRGILGAVIREGKSVRVADVAKDPRFAGFPSGHPAMRSFLGVPIHCGGRVLGNLYLTNKQGAGEFSETDLARVEALAAGAAVALENARLYEESKRAAAVEERQRLARELHDSVSQALFSSVLNAQAALRLLDHDLPRSREILLQLLETSREALAGMRTLICTLRPAAIEEKGLPTVLGDYLTLYARRLGMEAHFSTHGSGRIPGDIGVALFRIAQEALNNVEKHSMANKVSVSLTVGKRDVRLCVQDDGRGFDRTLVDPPGETFGLTSMEERARLAGGGVRITSALDSGTRIEARIPLARR